MRLRLRNKLALALSQSVDVRTMVQLARRIIPSYDIHERTGVPTSLSIPNRDVAAQIITDMIEEDRLLPFVELLVSIHYQGFAGRRMPIVGIADVMRELREDGYSFDAENLTFSENSGQRRTLNWGVLRKGENYHLAFLAADVVGNSKLVKRYGRRPMARVYADLRRLIVKSIEKRNGRLWVWEGDGGLATFYTGDVGTSAVRSGMEILHEVLLYNALWNPLDRPVEIRVAVHAGQIRYSDDLREIEAASVVKAVHDIEARYARPGTITISPSVFGSLDGLLQTCFGHEVPASGSPACRRYSPAFESVREAP